MQGTRTCKCRKKNWSRLHARGINTVGKVLKLLKSLYGRRDASVCFGDFLSGVIEQIGGERCIAQARLYFIRDFGVKCEVHQDDFHACAPRHDGLGNFKDKLAEHLVMKFSDIYGTEGQSEHLKCRRIKTRGGIYLIAAEKHTDKNLDMLGMKD